MLKHLLQFAVALTIPSMALFAQEPYSNGRPLRHWIQQLSAANPEGRARAADALHEIGPSAQKAIPILRDLAIRDEDSRVRLAAAAALKGITDPQLSPEQAIARVLAK